MSTISRKSKSDGGGLRADPAERGAHESGPKPPKRGGKRSPRPTKRPLLRRLLVWGATAAIWGAVAVAGLVGYYALDLPDIDAVTATTRRPSVVFLSADGEAFASYGDLYGEPVTLKDVPAALPKAVLATEDRRFASHMGVDPFGLMRAVFVNLRAGRVVQGGSTLTQQLAKNLFLTPERNLKRKVQELLMAFWLERRFTKDQILTLYLNRVYLGAGTYGVDAAAKRYFGVPASRLSLYQSALIAGLLKAPSRYNPQADMDASKKRTAQVLANMVDAGYVTAEQAAAAQKAGPGPVRRMTAGGRYFADWLRGQAETFVGPEDRDIVVRTTLDLKLQRKVEAELEATLAGAGAKAGVSQGAVVVMSPDGAIRAMAGGRDYDDSQFNRATQGLRQPGSAFKPFVYLAALEQGFSPDDLIDDAPIKLGKWSPQNFTGKYEGPVTLRHALAKSINTVAVRLADQVGAKTIIGAARRLGITSDLRNDTSIALGTSEVTLLEMTGAYAAFANGGLGAWPYGIAEIRDPQGAALYQRDGGGPGRLIAPEDVAKMNGMLAGVITEGTGRSAALDRPAAGKTGTTQDYRDAWFIGYTADLVAGVWLGNDDYGKAMKKVSGSGLPTVLWQRVMTAAHRDLTPRPLPGVGGAIPGMDPPHPLTNFEAELVDTVESVWDSLVKRLTGR